MSEFNREQRYVVVKINDINSAECTQPERDAFNVLCDKVARHRAGVGKLPLECVVVEKDWPEYEPTWAAIQRRVEGLSLPSIGSPFAGGYFAGEMIIEDERFALIVAPKAEGEKLDLQYKKTKLNTADGSDSEDDGFYNSCLNDNANHPAAQFCRALRIAGHDDWYLPSRDELMTIWMALGPNRKKATELFKSGGAEAFEDRWYWSSTEYAPISSGAWVVDFGDGYQSSDGKDYNDGVRAVRRIKI